MGDLRVLPLRRGGNQAVLPDWPRRASADPVQIEAWRREYPGCNWGILTGNGVGVLDLDTKQAPEWSPGGFGTLIDVCEILDIDLSHLPMVETYSGAHLYFRYDGHLPSRVPWVDFIDVMADGGHQVAAPGTVRELNGVERTYRVVRGNLRDIPYAPVELIEAIRTWKSPGRSSGRGGSPSPRADLPTTETAIREGLADGTRDILMHRLACRWWSDYGLDADATVWALARQVWDSTPNHDTFSWRDVEKCVRSARKHIAEEADKNLASVAAILKNWGRS